MKQILNPPKADDDSNKADDEYGKRSVDDGDQCWKRLRINENIENSDDGDQCWKRTPHISLLSANQ